MDKTLMGLLGAVSTLALMDAAHAATPATVDPAPSMQARSFADLLTPIPNASATLRALDSAASTAPAAGTKVAYDDGYGYHHHHHHSYYKPHYKPRYAPHYHHHHHHHYYNNGGGYNGGGYSGGGHEGY